METFSQFKANNSREDREIISRPLPVVQSKLNLQDIFDQSFVKIIAIVISIGIVVGYIFAIQTKKTTSFQTSDVDITLPKVEQSTTSKPSNIKVYVSGAVNTPGVVDLEHSSRVIDAITKAGGTKSNADISMCNFAAFISDGSSIYVPQIGDSNSAQTKNCGMVSQSVPPEMNATSSNSLNTGIDPKVNLNQASQAELEALPGIGPAMATSIISYRTKNGGFNSINDLRKVKGIGDKKFADLQDLVSI